MCQSPFLRKLQVLKPANLLKGEYCKIFKNIILVKICEQLLLTVNISFGCLFLLLIQQAFFNSPLEGLKSSPQGAQLQAPLLFEKKKKNQLEWSLVAFVVTRCTTRSHSLSFVVTRCTTRCHSLSLVVIRCHLLYHSMSLVVIRCHLLSLDVPLVCLFINDL